MRNSFGFILIGAAAVGSTGCFDTDHCDFVQCTGGAGQGGAGGSSGSTMTTMSSSSTGGEGGTGGGPDPGCIPSLLPAGESVPAAGGAGGDGGVGNMGGVGAEGILELRMEWP